MIFDLKVKLATQGPDAAKCSSYALLRFNSVKKQKIRYLSLKRLEQYH